MPPYAASIAQARKRNPCLTGLSDFLDSSRSRCHRCCIIDYDKHGRVSERVIDGGDQAPSALLTRISHPTSLRIIIIEDISAQMAETLGSEWDIDPMFFAAYVDTRYGDIEKRCPPPAIKRFPTDWSNDPNMLHMHYHTVLYLGDEQDYSIGPWDLATLGNNPRSARRLPTLSGQQLALGRNCFSIWRKKLGDAWICLLLVDNPASLKQGRRVPDDALQGVIQAIPLSKSYDQRSKSSRVTTHTSLEEPGFDIGDSMFDQLRHHFIQEPPSVLEDKSLTILSLSHHPMRVVLDEWMTYNHLLSRLIKHYEYTFHDIRNRLDEASVKDLQKWRRRCRQTLGKLDAIRRYVSRWKDTEPNPAMWEVVLEDVDFLKSDISRSALYLEQVLPTATSMAQLIDSRASAAQAENVSRLTYIAMVFVPLSWVAAFLSMADDFQPGAPRFWIYFAISGPLLVVVGILSWGSAMMVTGGIRRSAMGHSEK